MNENQILEEFLNLSSSDEAKRNKATETLSNYISSPQFLQYMIQLIINPEIQSQPNLYNQILIVLKACLKTLYSNCQTIDENYTKNIPISLIHILDSIPPQFHSYIIDYFRQINQIALTIQSNESNDNFFNNLQKSTVPFIIEQLKEQKNFVSNLFIFKLFLKFYIKESQDEELATFYNQILHEITPIIIGTVNSIEINEFTANSVKLAAQIMNLIIHSNIFKLPHFFEPAVILSMILNYCRYFQSRFENSSKLNRHLLKLSIELINLYYEIPEIKVNAYLPLFNCCMQLLLAMDANSYDSFVRFYSLKLIYNICSAKYVENDVYSANYFESEIFSPQFVSSVLIPSARLTEQDIDELNSMPYLIPFKFRDFKEQSDFSVRSVCRLFADQILRVPELHSIVERPSEDPIEFESHVFLLSCLEPKTSLISKDEIQFILNLAVSNIDSNISFLQASFLYYLYRYISIVPDCPTIARLAVSCINHSNDPIVILAAVDLLKSYRLDFNYIENFEEKNSIIPKLLSLCVSIHCWDPLDVIVKLVNSESQKLNEEMPTFLIEIISTLFQSCLSIVRNPSNPGSVSERELFTLSGTFDTILKIIENDSISDELIVFCLNHCALILKEAQSSDYLVCLFSFVSFFNYQLRTPLNEQFHFILLSLSSNENSSDFILDACYPLILNPQSSIQERQEFVTAIAQICQRNINNKFVFASTSSLLRVCGALIEVFGNNFINLAEIAFYVILNSDPEKNFLPLLYLLYTSVRVNPSLILSQFNEEIINCLLNNSVNYIANCYPYEYLNTFYRNEVKCHFCLLLEIARIGRQEGSPEILSNIAQSCFNKAIVVSKSFQSAEDFTSNSNYFNQRKFNSALAIRYFPNAISQIDEFKMFFEVALETGFNVSEEVQKQIASLANMVRSEEQL